MILTLQMLALFKLSGCRASSPPFGKAPIRNPLIVEDHCQALAHWAEKGVRGATLINIDLHDDIRIISDAKLKDLGDIYSRRDWRRFEEAYSLGDRSLYHVGNWIYAGARLGIFSEVCWVVPYKNFAGKNPDPESLRQLLHSYKFRDEDIKTFTLRENRFHGTFQGIPLTVCGIESLPTINRPVLLSFCIDFFPAYVSQYRQSYLTALHEVFKALYSREYRVQDAVVSYSINGEYLPPHLRWVGDAVGAIMRDPQQIDNSSSELLNLLQLLENGFRDRSPSEILQLTDAYLARFNTSSVLLYKAYAHMLAGDFEKTYLTALSSCNADKLYCSSLPVIGSQYSKKGAYREAERLFRAGFASNPGLKDGMNQYANCLRKLGKLEEALEIYKKDEVVNRIFPTRFLIFETLLMKGDRRAAEANLQTAVRNIERDEYAAVTSPATANAIYAAMDYCSRNKLRELGTALRNSPAVIGMILDYPRG